MPSAGKKKRTNPRTLSGTNDTCPICHEEITAYAVSRCNHPTCFVCAIRMRVLMEQTYCSICRASTPKIFCTKNLHLFEEIDTSNFLRDKSYDGVLFENVDIQKEVNNLLLNPCGICKKLFDNFSSLNTHVRREHEMFFCDLCLENLKIFTYERKLYKRSDLATHRRKGDSDDKSYRGHPLCEFCDKRFFDNDALIRHLRTEHFFCHFCEADQISNEFFSTYSDLKKHFKSKHFLCEEEECQKVQFTNAFRTEMDIRAHIARHHSNLLSKQEAKQIRTFGIDFSYRGSGRGRRYGGRGISETQLEVDTANVNLEEPKEPEKFKENPEDFPTLDGRVLDGKNSDRERGSESRDTMAKRLAFNTGRSVQEGEMGDFPALNKETKSGNNTGKWVRNQAVHPISNASSDFPQLPRGNKPIKFSSRPASNPAPVSVPSQPRVVKESEKPKTPAYSLMDDDFPNMPQSKFVPMGNVHSTSQESKISVVTPQEVTNTSNVIRQNIRPNVTSTDDFPALGNPKPNIKTPPSGVWKSSSKKEKKKKIELEPEPDPTPGLSLGEIASLIPNKKDKQKQKKEEKKHIEKQKNVDVSVSLSNLEIKDTKKPPPGFESVPRRISVDPPVPPSLSPPSLPSPPYVPVEDFYQRNEKLQKKVNSYLHDFSESLEKFKELAKNFLDETLTANEYYIECQKLVGVDEFKGIIEELIVLLPNIKKQNELLNAFNGMEAKDKRKTWKTTSHSLVVCPNCKQVLRTGDKKKHEFVHSGDNQDFPELNSSPCNPFGMNSWNGKRT